MKKKTLVFKDINLKKSKYTLLKIMASLIGIKTNTALKPLYQNWIDDRRGWVLFLA
jgi:hypothetical protein